MYFVVVCASGIAVSLVSGVSAVVFHSHNGTQESNRGTKRFPDEK